MKCASGRKLLIVIKVLSEQHVHLVLVPVPPVPGNIASTTSTWYNIASANAPEPPLYALYTNTSAPVHVHVHLVPASTIASINAPDPLLCAPCTSTSISAREASCGPGAAAVHVH